MSVDVGLWGKLTRAVIFLILLAGVLGVLLWYAPLIQRNERMRKEVLRLEGQIQQEEATVKRVKASIEALSRDPRAVERLVRERLGYAKAGETVIRFESTPTNAASRP
jgi:cell division protein FtsB